DSKFELDRLHDWKFGGLPTLKNATRVVAGETETVRSICAVPHQAARFDKRTVRGDRRYCMAKRHCSELFTAGTKKAIGPNHQRTCMEVRQSRERRIYLALATSRKDTELQSKAVC